MKVFIDGSVKFAENPCFTLDRWTYLRDIELRSFFSIHTSEC